MAIQLVFTPAACTAGGIILGIATAARLFCTGRVLGISGFVRGIVLGDLRSTRPLALLGLLAGASLMNAWLPSAFEALPPTFSYGRAVGAGLLVGFGTSLGRGCTSGHGICGNARLSWRSMVYTGIFMAFAIGIAAASNLSQALDIAMRGVVVQGAMERTAAITAAVVAPGGAALMTLLALAGFWATRQSTNGSTDGSSSSGDGGAAAAASASLKPKRPMLCGVPGQAAPSGAWTVWVLEAAAELLVGVLFAFGLGVSLMTHQTKVAGFLGIYYFPAWDLSLPFVMGAALFIALPAYQVALRFKLLPRPALKFKWDMPTATDLDGRLLLGGAMFGAGWGLCGICPGPALVNLVSRACTRQLGVLVGCMIAAMALEVHVLGGLARAGLLPAWLQWLAEPSSEKGSSACGGRAVTIRRGVAPSGRFASTPVAGEPESDDDAAAQEHAVAQLKVAAGAAEDAAVAGKVVRPGSATGDVELGVGHGARLTDCSSSSSLNRSGSGGSSPTASAGHGAVPPAVCG